MKDKKSSDTPEAPSAAASDVALIHGVSADGALHVIRRRGERLEAGALKPLREGTPIQSEVVSLKPRASCPMLCDVEVHYAPPQSAQAEARPAPAAPLSAQRKGPAQVATASYRDNWDSSWSGKKSDALN
jgi:hypothetical protein